MDEELLTVAEDGFRNLFGDEEAADAVPEVALSSRILSIGLPREHFLAQGSDPETFPVGFDRAMRVFGLRLSEELGTEATRSRSPLKNRLDVAQHRVQARMLRELLRHSSMPLVNKGQGELSRQLSLWRRRLRKAWTI
jgi:hypothetical protein